MMKLFLIFIVLTPQIGFAIFCYECNSRKNSLCRDLATNSLPGEGSPTPFPPKNGGDPPIYAYREDGTVILYRRDLYKCPPEVKSAELKDHAEFKENKCVFKDDHVLLVNCSYHHDDVNVTKFFCRKLDQKADRETWTVRKCGWLTPEDSSLSCKYVTSFDGKARTTYCSCNGDRCNMANVILNRYTLVTIVLIGLLSIGLAM